MYLTEGGVLYPTSKQRGSFRTCHVVLAALGVKVSNRYAVDYEPNPAVSTYQAEHNEGAIVSGKTIAAGAYLSRVDNSVNAVVNGVPMKFMN